MPNASQRAIVKATIPLLETGGEALTTHFYRTMLAEYPQVRPLFNPAHQASGDQPRALANGILMFARHIDQMEALGPLASQIINKHVALQVLPEHYPIVGTCLLRAIREVLGEKIATDEVIAAWAAAYGMLADILIGAESAEYDRLAQAPGGWRGTRPFRVSRKEAESAEITSFYLEPSDGGALLDFRPGQYIGLQLEIDGKELRRNYSLSSAPNGQYYRISVKRELGGVASGYLHAQVQVGDELLLSPPAGDFVLNIHDRPLVLISGGVGITPTLAMLEATLQDSQRPVHFIHYARNGAAHAFGKHLEALRARHPQLHHFLCYEDAQGAPHACDAVGRPQADQLAQWLPSDRDVDAYFLGPKPFMALVKRTLAGLGVPASQTRYEFFGPASALE